jgi:SWI/SNF-related matrix-associated actin-dependent regulator of chromatin subfamily A member 5
MLGTKDERKLFVAEGLPADPKTGKHKFDALVTSYEGILKEKGALGKIKWKYLIIDEAHRIKNENSSLSKVVRTMLTQFRVLITGTPLQNNLHELWALLNFLLPEVFGDAEQFDAWFNMSEANKKDNVIKKLHTVLRPFMLRRVKKDVARSLPPKKETKLFIGLTDMQQKWYTKVLSKDATELNALGGPDRVRLLNILMQLRKVCNHPYLFEGAEPGPPYSDGPHLWENSGKMLLLHKLLPKLKSKGSRVLIFSQMTRVLDILEDYFRLNGHGYCRIDGSTDGEKRDSQMEEFNEPGSPIFAFLLSTRAGGLGINLATADIVIIYDSDWNPQVDLQAMDRAHRIGQTKPVQVFRFISEGTVEEKIIERADRKLFLDAAVIQQGRLADQFKSVDKKELMNMVTFGADQILQSKGGTYSDEDIDALIERGEEKTSAIKGKLEKDAKHNLANFSLSVETTDTFLFDGKNYRGDKNKKSGNLINLPQRERKRNYDVNDYYREQMGVSVAPTEGTKKKKKGPTYHDIQLFDIARLTTLNEREASLEMQKQAQVSAIRDLRMRAKNAPSVHNSRSSVPYNDTVEGLNVKADELECNLHKFELSPEDKEEKALLLKEGFPDWSKKDFRAFCSSLERRGRFDVSSIVDDVSLECGKDEKEVKRYFVAFWTNYRRVNDWKRVLDRIEKGERKVNRLYQIRDALREKVERHLDQLYGTDRSKGPDEKPPTTLVLLHQSWHKMHFNYGLGYAKGRAYSEEEDAFLLYQMYKHGYGASERIRMELRRPWQFLFNWYIKTRSASEIQKRCDMLVKIIEKENELDARKKEQEEQKRLVEQEAEKSELPVNTGEQDSAQQAAEIQ